MYVKAKKSLGQHFLKDESIAQRIVESLEPLTAEDWSDVLEVGPGTGVLTKYLIGRDDLRLKLVEIDTESIEYLRLTYPQIAPSLLEADFLKMDLTKFFAGKFRIIGNFPYNISSQIFFKVLDYKEQIPEVVGMVQKEVAQRIAAPSGSKTYGILSVLLQAWYDIEYLFTVDEHVFIPPPKVKSAVIRLRRNNRTDLGCDPELFKKVIKTTFNQRRKTIRNSLKPIISIPANSDRLFASAQNANPNLQNISKYLEKRPEQLSVEEFIELTTLIDLRMMQEKI